MSIMSNDQRDISSTLRFMDPQTLRQYGERHKENPYIFPLVFQESQNRQRLHMMQQAAQGMQPQPKVNEQALAQMAPPRAQPMPQGQGQGIVDLGAPNMETMADGGIAGYPDDDFVTRNQSVVMMAGGGVARFAGEGPSLVRGDFFSQLDQQKADQINQLNGQLAIIEPQLRAAAASNDQQAIQLYSQQAQAIRNQISAAREATGNRVGAIDKLTTPAAPSADTSFRRQEDPRMKPGVAATAQPLITSDAAPKADTTRRNTTDPSATRKEPAQATTDVMGMFNQALKTADEKPNPLKADIEAINAAKVKAGEENVTGLEAINKQFSDIFKGKKDRLSNKEGEIAKMDKQVLGLAAVLAGARMMQTRGSIGEAIGAGIDTGTKQYIAGQDKINAAKDKLSDARDRLEELEAQRGEMSARELHKARNEVKALTTAGMEDLVKAAMAERKMNRTEAISFVEQQIKVSEGAKDRSSREGIARLQASTTNRPGAEMQAVERIMAERKIPFTEALAVYKATQREPQTSETLLKAWSGNMLLQQQYPNPQDYIKMMAGSTGGASQLSPADAALVNKYSR